MSPISLTFEDFKEILGATVKGRHGPSERFLFGGVKFELGPDMVSVFPTRNRRHKLRYACQKYFVATHCRPRESGSFGGKATVFNTSCMGRVGRVAVSLACVLHHASHHVATVTHSLRAALVTDVRIATSALLRTQFLVTDWRPIPLVYAERVLQFRTASIRQTDLIQNSDFDWMSRNNCSVFIGVS